MSDNIQYMPTIHPNSSTKILDDISEVKFSERHSLKIIYLNARSLNNKQEEIDYIIAALKHNIHVISITETWINENDASHFTFNGYHTIFSCRPKKSGGGSAIFIKNTIPFEIIDNFSSNDNSFVSIRCLINNANWVITTVYRAPKINNEKLQRFFFQMNNHLDKINSIDNARILVSGDFNINTRNENNPIAQRHIDNMTANGLYICDSKTITRRATSTAIDHIFTNNLTTQINLNYITYDILDHRLICIEFTETKIPHTKVNYTVKKINFEKLDADLKNDPIQTDTDSPINEMYNDFVISLKTHIDRCTTTKSFSILDRAKPWTDEELIKLYAMKNFWYSKKTKYPNNPEIINEYNTARNKATKAARTKKRKYYENKFKKSIGDNKKTWETIKQVLYNGNKKPKKNPISTMKNKKIFINQINKFVATIGKKLAEKFEKNDITHYPITTTARFKLQPITEEDLTITIRNMKNTKSEGHDKISVDIIKRNIEHLKKNITIMINKIMETGTIPDNMKITKITPVYKEGDPNDCSNYRPICLLPMINKILEKIINDQLLAYLEENNLIYSHQFGFRKKSNTSTALIDFITVVQRALDKKKKVGALFIDKKKAFETVDQKILLQKLSSIGIIGIEHLLFQNYFSNRQQYIATEGVETDCEDISIGVPQGANLASTLFLVYINDIKDINIDGLVFLYADDIAIVTIEGDVTQLQETMNQNCEKIHRWMMKNKLTLNTNKTKYIIFRTPINHRIRVTYNGFEFERTETAKYLGITIDQNMNWKPHITQTKNKLAAITGIFRKIATYIPKEKKRQLFFAVFSSRLNYGISIWSSASDTDLKQIQTLQNKAIRNLFQHDRMERTKFIHEENKILTVKQQTHYQLANHAHNIHNKHIISTTTIKTNSQYHNHYTRNATHIHVDRTNTKRWGSKQSINRAIQIYNAMPNDMKMLNNKQFKLKSKEYFHSRFCI